MKKAILIFSFIALCFAINAQNGGHLFVKISKPGIECDLNNGLILKDSLTIHLPQIKTTFEDIVNDSITVRAVFHVFQDTTMYFNGGKPQISRSLNDLKVSKFDKDEFTFTNWYTLYLREELKSLFGVSNTDIEIIKK